MSIALSNWLFSKRLIRDPYSLQSFQKLCGKFPIWTTSAPCTLIDISRRLVNTGMMDSFHSSFVWVIDNELSNWNFISRSSLPCNCSWWDVALFQLPMIKYKKCFLYRILIITKYRLEWRSTRILLVHMIRVNRKLCQHPNLKNTNLRWGSQCWRFYISSFLLKCNLWNYLIFFCYSFYFEKL